MQRLLELGKTQHGISGKSTGGAGSRGRLVGPGKNQLDLERLAGPAREARETQLDWERLVEKISGWQNYCRPFVFGWL